MLKKQLRLLGQPDGERFADRISVFRAELQKHSGVVAAIDQQKVKALHRLAKLLKPEAVQRESGETLFDAVARLYGWHTNDELEQMLHSLQGRKPGQEQPTAQPERTRRRPAANWPRNIYEFLHNDTPSALQCIREATPQPLPAKARTPNHIAQGRCRANTPMFGAGWWI